MTIYLATKTIDAINAAIEKDQGAKFREHLGKVMPTMKDAFNSEESKFRGHLGASMIGRECARELWYGFHWSLTPKFEGRMIRLFNRGHIEEARMIAMLQMIGCEVFQQDENGNQYRISDARGHFGGSGDGVARGLPDLPSDMYALLEFKTHNDKSFSSLKANGVKESKPEHYIQMNIYMRKMQLPAALYLAVNKNTDELHGEFIACDTAIADQFLDRAKKIIEAEVPPHKLNNSPGFFKCKWCGFHSVCHMKATPAVNCRTCEHSVPVEDGKWACKKLDVFLDKEAQLAACEQYEKRSDL